ncbi:TonB-dependent receptor [Massilia sp. CT11-137]|uniref:TonB-dependent receptor n=1 Tax=Massilia sp. CT11-137 TaxID=3393901 RepID=UPI0039B0888D
MRGCHGGLLASVFLVAGTAACPATGRAQDAKKDFDIPAGPATSTINLFAKQGGINVLASEDVLNGICTNPVRGSFLVADALPALLAGTGLDSRVTAGGAVFIVAAGKARRDRPSTCAPVGHDPAKAARHAQPASASTAVGEPYQVAIVATRASQQSGIERKKGAATLIDSIVAEDVGSLPDRNVGAAISRMSGVALDRGTFGEGVSVSVRGNEANLTRVELDGQGVQSAGGIDMNGGGGGRGVEFRQLSADLIKSVDVVKGSTADMTEGSLGGSVVIKTRTALDFRKPFVSIRTAASQSALNRKWAPDANVILAHQYLDGRLGLLLNATSTTLDNEAHAAQVAQSAQQGYFRLLDFDQSPRKTFTYQPGTVNTADAAATTPFLRAPLAGGGYLDSATPLDLVSRSAAAQTKADCYAAFPALTKVQTTGITSAAMRGQAVLQRGNELISCLNQWNDYTPSNVRYFVKREVDRRRNLDLRADFKVNDRLSLYAKGSYNRRNDDISQLTYSLGNLQLNQASSYSPTYAGPTYSASPATMTRSAVPGSGYYRYEQPSTSGYNVLAGTVANVNPASVTVDGNHHVTQYTISDGTATTDQLHDVARITTRYLQLGGTYRNGGMAVEFFVGDARSGMTRGQKRTSFDNAYGPVTMHVLPNGLWGYTLPAGSTLDQANPAQYATAFPGPATGAVPIGAYNTTYVPAYTAAQQPRSTQAPETYWLPTIRATGERTVKLDAAWATPESIPLFKRFKTGFNLRDTGNDAWDPYAGNSRGWVVRTPTGTYGKPGYVPPVIVPSALLRGTFVGCQDTAGSLAPGGNACKYGDGQSADPRSALQGQNVMTVGQFQDIIGQSLIGKATPTRLFSGATGRPAGLPDNWTRIDVDKVFALAGVPNLNFDCLKQCMGSDGKRYDQPVQRLTERSAAFYVMGDFGVDHIPFTSVAFPFGWELEGNMGYRYILTRVHGIGTMNFTSIAKTASYDPANPNAAGGTVSSTYSQNTAVDGRTHDFLPIYNLALWVVPDKAVVRYGHARAVARPSVAQLLPAGTCTYDERVADAGLPQTCSGTIGNPALQAQRNVNQDLSLEYYPNKDTMFSVAAFRQEGKTGPALPQGVGKGMLFGGSAMVDPGTGAALSGIPFNYSTYSNGVATTRKGLELGARTAFTFLPWMLRHTGFDGNYTKLRSVASSLSLVDLLTGAPLPPARESRYSYNAALWYDDGRLSARVAVQAVASFFNCVAGCGQPGMANYPSAAGGITNVLPYNPGSPNFRDGTRFIDGKISYRVRPNVDVFIEGRNLGNAITSTSQGPFAPFADGTPNLLDYAYSGRRIMVGINVRSM